MIGRPLKYGPPGPICKRGHRRTVKTTMWPLQFIHGKYYIQPRCRLCDAIREHRYRAHKKTLQRLALERRDQVEATAPFCE